MARKDVTDSTIAQDMEDANDNFIELYLTKTEIENARDGEANLLAQIDDIQADIVNLQEITASEIGVPSLSGETGKSLVTDGSTILWENRIRTDETVSVDAEIALFDSTTGQKIKRATGTGMVAITDGVMSIADITTAAGTDTTSSATDITLDGTNNRVQSIAMTASDKFVNLPDATALFEGADTYVIINDGDYRFGLKDNAGTFICSIAPHSQGRLSLLDNSTSAGTWKASDPADLIMNTLKTECNTDASIHIASCKLSATELFVAWQGAAADGFCAVLTFGGTITVSNILEFDTADATWISCDAISATVAAVAYTGTTSHGKIAAITWDGVDTLVVTDTYTFLAASMSNTNVHVVTSGLVFVAYTNGTYVTCAQMLSWNGSVFASETAESTLGGTDRFYPKTAKISGDATDAKFVLVHSGTLQQGTVRSAIITWNSSTGFAIGTDTLAISLVADAGSRGYHLPITIDSDYFLILQQYDPGGDMSRHLAAVLCHVSGTTITNKRYLIFGSNNNSFVTLPIGGFLFDSETVFLFTSEKGYENYLYKIKVVGAADTKDCVLSVENKVAIGYNSGETDLYVTGSSGDATLLSGNNTAIVYRNLLASNYLYAEKVEIA